MNIAYVTQVTKNPVDVREDWEWGLHSRRDARFLYYRMRICFKPVLNFNYKFSDTLNQVGSAGKMLLYDFYPTENIVLHWKIDPSHIEIKIFKIITIKVLFSSLSSCFPLFHWQRPTCIHLHRLTSSLLIYYVWNLSFFQQWLGQTSQMWWGLKFWRVLFLIFFLNFLLIYLFFIDLFFIDLFC